MRDSPNFGSIHAAAAGSAGQAARGLRGGIEGGRAHDLQLARTRV